MDEIFDALRRPVDEGERHEHYDARVGGFRVRLLRDCHGALRRVEVVFPGSTRDGVRAHMARLGNSSVLDPERLEILDVPALGRMVLSERRLDIALRTSAPLDRITGLLVELVGQVA